MEINRQARAKARRHHSQDYEAVDSSVSPQEADPVHRHSEKENRASASGVIVRAPKNHGESAIQKAKDILNNVPDSILKRPKSTRRADREWFEKNKGAVQHLIKEPIRLDKREVLGRSIESKFRPSKERLEDIANQGADLLMSATDSDLSDFENYRPVIDDDAEFYVPESER